ncbi:MAG: hypothetical protein SGBAC_003796 [Bacillariaceae sp.]
MPLMRSLRRSKSPYRDTGSSEQGSSEMLSPIQSEESSSSFAYTGDDDFDEDAPPKPSSQIRKLKKVFSRKPRISGSNDYASVSSDSLAASIRGEEVFRIAINEDSMYDDSSIPASPRWNRTVGAVVKPPSVQKLDALMGDSCSESEEEGYSSRRSTLRTCIDDDMNDLDDSTHPLPSMAPPSLSDLSTFSSKMGKSSKSVDTAKTMQMSDLSFRTLKTKSSLVSYSSDSYSQFSAANSNKVFLKNSSSRANSSIAEESLGSRASTIRSAVEQSLDESTHPLPSPAGPLHHHLQANNGHKSSQSSIAESSNISTISSRQRSDDSSSEESSDEESNHVRSTKSLRKGRKSRSPRPPLRARDTSGRSRSRKSPAKTRSGKSKSPSSNRSSKSPHKMTSDAATLQQIIGPDYAPTSSPSLRGERTVWDRANSERGSRFIVRRTVSSPVQPRKQLRPNQEERSEQMRRSITGDNSDTSRSPSGPRRRSLVLKNSMNDEISERIGVSPLRGSLFNRSTMSERGIRSIDTRDFPGIQLSSEVVPRNSMARSSSPGLRFRNMSRQTTRSMPIDKRKSHSTRAERSINIDMEFDEVNRKGASKSAIGRGMGSPENSKLMEKVKGKGKIKTSPIDKRKSHSTRAERTVPIDVESDEESNHKAESKTFHGRQSFSFDTESGDESLTRDDEISPLNGLLLKRVSDGGIMSSISESGDRTIVRRNSTGLRVDMTGIGSRVARSNSPGIRLFGNSIRQTRTTPTDKRRSHSTRAERTIRIDDEFDGGYQNEQPRRGSLGTKVKDKIKSLKSKNISLRGRRSIDLELDEEKPKLKSKSSRRERRSIDVDSDEDQPKRKSKSSRRERRSIDVDLDEGKPDLKSKSSRRERRSINVDLDEGKPDLKSKSSRRERRSIDIDLDEGKPDLKSKSSRRERRSIDLELDEEKPKLKSPFSGGERRSIDAELDDERIKLKSKSSRRERRSIDVELDEEKGKKSKSSRRERRTLSIDVNFGSDRKLKSIKSGRRTLSVDSGESLEFESKPPKGKRSLLTESLGETAETLAREPRSRSRKKDIPKKKSKGKTPSKTDDDGNETYSTCADAGDISVDGPKSSGCPSHESVERARFI